MVRLSQVHSFLPLGIVERHDLAHGKRLVIDHADAEKAHQIVYQSIKWIENLPENSA
jgi:hypothetical protein